MVGGGGREADRELRAFKKISKGDTDLKFKKHMVVIQKKHL